MEIEFDKGKIDEDKTEEAKKNINGLIQCIKKQPVTIKGYMQINWYRILSAIIFLNCKMIGQTVDLQKENINTWFKLDNNEKKIGRLFDLIIFEEKDINGGDLTKDKRY